MQIIHLPSKSKKTLINSNKRLGKKGGEISLKVERDLLKIKSSRAHARNKDWGGRGLKTIRIQGTDSATGTQNEDVVNVEGGTETGERRRAQ